MSKPASAEKRRREKLSKLMEVENELELIATSDVPYAKDARNWLESLDDAGFEVNLPHQNAGSTSRSTQRSGEDPDGSYCSECGDGVGAEDRFCRHCGHELPGG